MAGLLTKNNINIIGQTFLLQAQTKNECLATQITQALFQLETTALDLDNSHLTSTPATFSSPLLALYAKNHLAISQKNSLLASQHHKRAIWQYQLDNLQVQNQLYFSIKENSDQLKKISPESNHFILKISQLKQMCSSLPVYSQNLLQHFAELEKQCQEYKLNINTKKQRNKKIRYRIRYKKCQCRHKKQRYIYAKTKKNHKSPILPALGQIAKTITKEYENTTLKLNSLQSKLAQENKFPYTANNPNLVALSSLPVGKLQLLLTVLLYLCEHNFKLRFDYLESLFTHLEIMFPNIKKNMDYSLAYNKFVRTIELLSEEPDNKQQKRQLTIYAENSLEAAFFHICSKKDIDKFVHFVNKRIAVCHKATALHLQDLFRMLLQHSQIGSLRKIKKFFINNYSPTQGICDIEKLFTRFAYKTNLQQKTTISELPKQNLTPGKNIADSAFAGVNSSGIQKIQSNAQSIKKIHILIIFLYGVFAFSTIQKELQGEKWEISPGHITTTEKKLKKPEQFENYAKFITKDHSKTTKNTHKPQHKIVLQKTSLSSKKISRADHIKQQITECLHKLETGTKNNLFSQYQQAIQLTIEKINSTKNSPFKKINQSLLKPFYINIQKIESYIEEGMKSTFTAAEQAEYFYVLQQMKELKTRLARVDGTLEMLQKHRGYFPKIKTVSKPKSITLMIDRLKQKMLTSNEPDKIELAILRQQSKLNFVIKFRQIANSNKSFSYQKLVREKNRIKNRDKDLLNTLNLEEQNHYIQKTLETKFSDQLTTVNTYVALLREYLLLKN